MPDALPGNQSDLTPTPSVPENRKARIFNPKSELFPFKREIQLTEKQKQSVTDDLDRLYLDWDSNAGQLRSQLLRWVNNSEGISEPTDFPWPGSSTLYKPMTETRMNIVHAFWMSILRPKVGQLFNCVTDKLWDKEEVQLAQDLTQYFNNERAFNRMYLQSASESFTASMRDGTVGRSLDWERKVEKRWEIVTYKTSDEFLAKNPAPESLGMSEESYTKILEKLSSGIPVALDEEYNVVTKNMPVIDTEEIKDLVIYPMTVSRQDRTKLLGKRFWLRASELNQRAEDGLYDKEAVKKVIESTPVEDQRDTVSNFQDSIEGISQPTVKSDYCLIQCRYYFDYDGDGIEEKMLITFEVNSKTLLQCDKYPFYHNNDFIKLSRFKRRPKRILGRGVCQMLDDVNTEANIQARFRVNSMAIINAPHFKADETLKSRLDPNRPENRIRPGGIWWLPKNSMKDVESLVQDGKNMGDLFREEVFLNQTADNLLGASELRSGRETPNDPRAPAAKTQLLLQQSSQRLDDFIFDAILVENEILDDALKLYYQFGPEKLKTYVRQEPQPMPGGPGMPGMIPGQFNPLIPGVIPPQPNLMPGAPLPGAMPGNPMMAEPQYIEKVIERSKLNRDTLHLQLSVTSLLDNPEYLLAKWEETFAKYGADPMVGGVLESRWEILNNIFQNKPETSGKKILLPLQEILMKMPKAPPSQPGAPAPGSNGKAPAIPAGV